MIIDFYLVLGIPENNFLKYSLRCFTYFSERPYFFYQNKISLDGTSFLAVCYSVYIFFKH